MKIITNLLTVSVFVLALLGSGRALAMDANGCIQPGDPGYNPKLTCNTPAIPNSGPTLTPQQQADMTQITNTINNPASNPEEGWSAKLQEATPNLQDSTDMHISIFGPWPQPDGTVAVLIGINANGRPIPPGILPTTYMGHKVIVVDQPFFHPWTKTLSDAGNSSKPH